MWSICITAIDLGLDLKVACAIVYRIFAVIGRRCLILDEVKAWYEALFAREGYSVFHHCAIAGSESKGTLLNFIRSNLVY